MSNGEQGYNGWTNWETWNVSLWLGEWDMVGEAMDAVGLAYRTGKDQEAAIKEYCTGVFGDDRVDEYGNRFFVATTPDGADILGDEIDWSDIAETYLIDWKRENE